MTTLAVNGGIYLWFLVHFTVVGRAFTSAGETKLSIRDVEAFKLPSQCKGGSWAAQTAVKNLRPVKKAQVKMVMESVSRHNL